MNFLTFLIINFIEVIKRIAFNFYGQVLSLPNSSGHENASIYLAKNMNKLSVY